MNKAYLYVLRFEEFFKIGITIDLKRIDHLSEVFHDYRVSLENSYLLRANSTETCRAWERFLHDEFKSYKYDFEEEKYEGYTECFENECFEEAHPAFDEKDN